MYCFEHFFADKAGVNLNPPLIPKSGKKIIFYFARVKSLIKLRLELILQWIPLNFTKNIANRKLSIKPNTILYLLYPIISVQLDTKINFKNMNKLPVFQVIFRIRLLLQIPNLFPKYLLFMIDSQNLCWRKCKLFRYLLVLSNKQLFLTG